MFSILGRIIDWAGEYKKRLYLGILCSFFSTWFTALPTVIAAWALGLVVDDLNGKAELTWNQIGLSLIGIILSIFFRFLFSYWKAKLQESIGYEVAASERIEIGDILKRVSLGYFSKSSVGDITTAITSDLSILELQGMKLVDTILNGYINFAAIVLMLLFVSPQAALIAVIGALCSALFLKLILKHSDSNAEIKHKTSKELTDAAFEYIRGLAIVKSFGQQGVSINEWINTCKEHKKINFDIVKGFSPFNCLHLLSLKIASVGLIIVGGMLTINKSIELPFFLMIAMFAFMIFNCIEGVNDSIHMLGIVKNSMDKLENIKNTHYVDKAGRDINISNYDIEFENVSFGYEDKEVLHNVSFKMPQNTSTAIVGPSGSGKSTICSLVTRFYDANKGTIKIGGRDINEFTYDSLLSNFSMVFQNVYLFHDTIKNNIKFGKPKATDAEIIEAAKKACCHDFIMDLPEGYDTMVGEGGDSLSGGQKQRISIARAMLKDAPIIILDEATASIDPENEHLIQQAISELVSGKTIITIAHRLATIENADQILVVADGKIIESGKHSELIKKQGIYKKFISIREKTEGWKIS
ncbi:MAG: ABC transporter ATP-binding protein [Clostridiaceae bacterium]|nr:ABC transporter ATP-binding protein [Clostridiaceae bacterium]